MRPARALWTTGIALLAAVAMAPPASAAGTAPGEPGASANWMTGNKQGLGTATGQSSKVWYTLSDGALSEVYFPRGDTADVRSLEFAVTDGATFADRESEDTTHAVELVDDRSLSYRQVNTAKSGRYRIVKTYTTDTRRDTVLMRVTFEPLQPGPTASSRSTTRRCATPRGMTPLRAAAPAPTSLLATDGSVASALVSSSGFVRTSSGFVGTSDAWTDLETDHRLDWDYDAAPDGNVLQAGELALKQDKTSTFTLALGFADSAAGAEATARASLRLPFQAVADSYMDGWHDYLRGLTRVPRALSEPLRTQYNVSVMTIKAHEDKTFRGAFIASLTLPWGFAVERRRGRRRLSLRLGARSLPPGDRDAGRRRSRRGRPRRDVAVRAPAVERRHLPAELEGRRNARPAQPATRRGRVPDRPGVAAGTQRGHGLERRAQGRRRDRRQGPDDAAGALGGDRRLLELDAARDDRRAGGGL